MDLETTDISISSVFKTPPVSDGGAVAAGRSSSPFSTQEGVGGWVADSKNERRMSVL